MANNEFNFHERRHRPVDKITISTPKSNVGLRQFIMTQYDRFTELGRSDEEIVHLQKARDAISLEITRSFTQLQESKDKEVSRQLNLKLNQLTDQYKKIDKDYLDLLRKHLSDLYAQYPPIFEKIVGGIDRETLDDVLGTFEKYQRGQINANQAVKSGMDFMTTKHHLPPDFFNTNNIDQFTTKMQQT
jgi:hypothetical protein